MSLSTGKIAEVIFEKYLETYEHQMMMVDLVDVFKHNSADMQNAGNVIWRPVQQHRPVLKGWDLTGQEQGIIEETYPAFLGEPNNDLVELRADDLRDQRFWERAGEQAGYQQATQLNSDLADMVARTGSLYYDYSGNSGYEFIAEAQALINERQTARTGQNCYFLLNDRDTLRFGSDLAGRQTLQGRPEQTWKTGQIGQNVAGFDVFTASFLPNLAGGDDGGGTTIGADVSEKPEGGLVDPITQNVSNVDYRKGTLTVADTTGWEVGNKLSINLGAPNQVNSLGLADKSDTGQAMTFTVVNVVDATTLEVFPKPIALDDPALTALEAAYANINTQILTGMTVRRVNGASSVKTNAFWCQDSIEITAGDAPMSLMSEFGGMKVVSSQLKSGQTMYMMYDGDITKATFRYRLFTWYGVTNKNPAANGVAAWRANTGPVPPVA